MLQESLFEDTKLCDWKKALAPKCSGSRNLHEQLPRSLGFFILLSSVMGIVGTKKLVAYNTGNTYQAALARYRRSIGENAPGLFVSISAASRIRAS